MKKTQILIKLCLGIGLIALAMTIGEYLALHDIWHDYVSKQVIENYGGGSYLKLPDWSETRLEWHMVNISGLIKVFYFIFSLVTFVICLKAFRIDTHPHLKEGDS
jgi:succinate dehydrogenase hydrophobic anchor subunit